MEGDSAMWLLPGLHIGVYVRLDNFSFHFADAAKQIFKFSAREVLGTRLVGSDLVNNFFGVLAFVQCHILGGFLNCL